MFRNLIAAALLAPFAAALPIIALLIGAGLLGAIFSANPGAIGVGIGQSFYVLFGAYFFGWPTALLIGAGNGIVWLLVKHPYKRLLFSPAVGFAAAMVALGFMLFVTTRPLDALPALLGFGVLAAIASSVVAFIVFASGSDPVELPS